ncbi:hypothetical protein PVAND_003770 [Polypedilum vanderplanki]|uniref:Fork-head domain-containing protein n=1 Tax=Polypedilum vanderplanki TaxID=319348 RepID=A0A9J6BWX2_POLVA|nr:hypothetical protein PVAND_003770 [Polypedilum vanderplanki]
MSEKKICDLTESKKTEEIKSSSNMSPHCSSSSASSSSPVVLNNPVTATIADKSMVPNISQQALDIFERSNNNFLFPSTGGDVNEMSSAERYRLQFCNYALLERMRNQTNLGLQHLYQPFSECNSQLAFSFFQTRVFQAEEPKPQHSYIGLIAMAILNSPEQKLVLSDIYQHILDNYPYFRARGPGWRNSIRHNLSLNDCFIKAGRSANGKGHYWAVHPANIEDFKKGDFRRRKAQRKVRKHMGLSVDENEADSPSPPPLTFPPLIQPPNYRLSFSADPQWNTKLLQNMSSIYNSSARKRQFDVASLLAPDNDEYLRNNFIFNSKRHHLSQETEDEDIDVVAHDNDEPKDLNRLNSSSASIETNQKTPWNHGLFMTDNKILATPFLINNESISEQFMKK